MDVGASLMTFLDDVRANVWTYLTALTALSVVTMALIQAAKTLLPLRRLFNRRRLRAWLEAHAATVNARADRRVDAACAGRRLLVIAADGDEGAFYDPDVDDLCVQLNAAVQLLVDYPSYDTDLLRIAVSAATPEDLEAILRPTRPLAEDLAEPESRRDRATADGRQVVFDARNRIRMLAQRSVEAFRLSTSARWKRALQIASFLMSTMLTAIALGVTPDAGSRFKSWVGVAAASAIAGFLAPVGRDLLAAVEKLRE